MNKILQKANIFNSVHHTVTEYEISLKKSKQITVSDWQKVLNNSLEPLSRSFFWTNQK